MRILITGAGGFIGKRLVRLLAAEHEVFALYHTDRGPDLPHVSWIQHDLSEGTLPPELPACVDVLIHLAQSKHYREFPDRAADILAVGAGATFQLLEWARKAGAVKFILASTGGLYGWSNDPVRETDALVEEAGPLSFYFAVKRASELIASQYARCFPMVILRFFFVYGSDQGSAMLMPKLVEAVRGGRPITLQGDSGIRINPIHVSDAVQAVAQSLTLQQSQVINVAGPTAISLRRICELIGQQVGHLPVFTTNSDAPPHHLVADINRMTALLGAPKIHPGEGIVELCSALKRQANPSFR